MEVKDGRLRWISRRRLRSDSALPVTPEPAARTRSRSWRRRARASPSTARSCMTVSAARRRSWARLKFPRAKPKAERQVRVRLSCALIAAALWAAPSALADSSTSSNWAGYAIHHSHVTFNKVIGAWQQPKLSCTPGVGTYSAYWIGLGGYDVNSNALEQIGTEADCSMSGAGADERLVRARARAVAVAGAGRPRRRHPRRDRVRHRPSSAAAAGGRDDAQNGRQDAHRIRARSHLRGVDRRGAVGMRQRAVVPDAAAGGFRLDRLLVRRTRRPPPGTRERSRTPRGPAPRSRWWPAGGGSSAWAAAVAARRGRRS